MNSSSKLLLSLALISTQATFAATEFGETIPTRLAEIFAGVGSADTGLYADIPEEFPPFTVPAEFMVLGSVTRDFGNTVYLSTTLDDAAAKEAIVKAFTTGGWQEVAIGGPPGTNAGFAGNNRVLPKILCHDDYASLQINTAEADDGLLVTINHSGGTRFVASQQPSCSEMVASSQQRSAGVRGFSDPLQEYLPRLELPAEVSRGRQPGGTGGITGGSDQVTSYTELMIDWDLARLYDFFADQITAQGWMPDGNSLTPLIAGGSWTHTPAAGVNLLGLLSVIKKADDTYKLEFRLITLPAQPGN